MPTYRRFRPLALPLVCLGFVCWAITGRAEAPQPPVVLLGKANVLPLALDSSVDIRKAKTYFLETPEVVGLRGSHNQNTQDQSISFERRRLLYGAITPSDIRARYGNYFSFFWRSRRPAHLTVRLEYRQQKLGAFVQAREVDYPAALGGHETSFNVAGDDYSEQGRVSAWRLVIIEDHEKIVALKQSYLWR